MKQIGKGILITAGFLLLSILIANYIGPMGRKAVSESYQKQIRETEFLSDTAGSERVLCVDDNEAAMLWRLRMIGAAKNRIVLSTFDLRTDENGTIILAALYDAAERGVEVKVLIDGVYQPLFLQNEERFDTFSQHENIEVRFYNPISFRNSYRLNYRMHDKYLMIDKRMYMLGGRNTNDIFLGAHTKGINEDRDILVYATKAGEGESFQQLEQYFQKIWTESCCKPYHAKATKRGGEQLKAAFREAQKRYPDIGDYKQWIEATKETNKITLLANETTPGLKAPQVLYALGQLAKDSRNVWIQTPYVICDEYMYSVLENMTEDAQVHVILNAVERGSNPWGCTDYQNNKDKILDTGVTVYELMNPHAVHTKTILIDERISVVGSYNLDRRSTYLDTELMLVIDSEELNTHIKKQIDTYVTKSKMVCADGTTTYGPEYAPRELSESKERMYQMLRILIRGCRHLL